MEQQIADIMARHGCPLFGFADLIGLTPVPLARFPRGVSLALPMDPQVMGELTKGPTQDYARLYHLVNQRIDALCAELAQALEQAGHGAWAVPSSLRSDPKNIRGDFPHKTAATRAGLGWVGRNAQLVTRPWGPWVRLGTVLTDAPLPVAEPITKSLCGQCSECIDACPAHALAGGHWRPGIDRGELLDAAACDGYKKTHFADFSHGHNCGICTSACPVGRKQLRAL